MNSKAVSVFYNALVYLLFPFLFISMMIHALFDKRVREGNLFRFGFLKPQKTTRKSVWLHAVSVGEVAAVKKLVEKITNVTEYELYISTTTANGYDMAVKMYEGCAIIFYFPLDFVHTINPVFDIINPALIIVAEIEIWPNFLRTAYKRNIPLYLINGRIGKKEYDGYKNLQWFFKPYYKSYTKILAQSAIDEEKMIDVGMPEENVILSGNIKYDVDYVLDDEKLNATKKLLAPSKKILVLGSSHSGEEDAVLKACSKLKNKDEIFLVVVPRDISRGAEIAAIMKTHGLTAALRTETNEYSDYDALIVDTIGELLYYYNSANVVVMGGSFLKSVGGHNILEAIYFKKPVIVGPQMHNFIEMNEYFRAGGGVFGVDSTEEIGEALEMLFSDEEKSNTLGAKGYELLMANRGACDKTFDVVFNKE